jgi:ferrous iron transport protein B
MPDTPPPAPPLTIALVGNPNTGKSTLFNALSGLRALTGNYPGCTVERKVGKLAVGDAAITLVDLPGTYSLAPRSLDEMVAVDVLLGRRSDTPPPDGIVCILDASNLERNLYVVSQVLDLGLPTVLVLNMADVAAARGVKIDIPALERELGCPVVATEAHRKQGIDELKQKLVRIREITPTKFWLFPEPFQRECRDLAEKLSALGEKSVPEYLLERLLLDVGGWLESHFANIPPAAMRELLEPARARLSAEGCRVPSIEAKTRYAWARGVVSRVATQPAVRPRTRGDAVDRVLTHWFAGMVLFALLMIAIFQAIYHGATPLMELCDAAQGWLGDRVGALLPAGPLRSLVVDGVIGGVGGVLIFLPQIVILFLCIALLEDCGYMSRAAFLMDRLMTRVGLSGKSFVPLMSSFACAIPGIMATRVIENRRDRFTTILVAPLMSCSARQPVYALLIAAFIPAASVLGGWVDVRSLTLLAMSSLGAVVAVPIAFALKSTVFKGETPPFVMELPPYKWPSPGIVLTRVYASAKSFVMRAGTLILATSLLVWALGYFPADHAPLEALSVRIEELGEELAEPLALRAELESRAESMDARSSDELSEAERKELSARQTAVASQLEELGRVDLKDYDELVTQKNQLSADLLERSFLGRLGHFIEPVVKPLGWDWKIGVGVLASFPAREVIVSTLGTIYSLGGEVDESSGGLADALKASKWPDGRPVFTIPVALSIMVFFALCAQCASTLMVIRRETNSWGWAAFTFAYMTALAYAGAFVTVRVAEWFV